MRGQSYVRHIRFVDFMEWVCFKIKSKLQVAEWYTAAMLLLTVPFFYLERLVPPIEEFSLFSPGYYPNIQSFFRSFIFWIVPAIISTQYYFICRHKWGIFLGILSVNYWWMTLCTVGWATGLIQAGEQLYMLPAALIWSGCLYRRRMQWRKKAYKDKTEKTAWTRRDYFIGAAMLLAASLIHVYPLFPKTESFYFFHSEWFHDVREFIYYLGFYLSNIIWMTVWFFDRANKWLYIYISWPLTMFVFKAVSMIFIEIGISTVANAYLFLLPLTILLSYILFRIRKGLYIRTHYKKIKGRMFLRIGRGFEWVRNPIVLKKYNRFDRTFWKDFFISFALLFAWFFIRSDLSDFICMQLALNEQIHYEYYSEIKIISEIISHMLFIIAFSLWIRLCTLRWMRPYIAMAQTICCFSLLAHLEVNLYEESGYYISILGMIFGMQLWRERQYFLNEAFEYERLEQEDHDKQRNIIKAKENLCVRGYNRTKQSTREELEKVRKDKEADRNSIFQVALCDKVCLQWREYMAEQYDKRYQELLAYDIELSERHTKEMEKFKKLKERLNRNAPGD